MLFAAIITLLFVGYSGATEDGLNGTTEAIPRMTTSQEELLLSKLERFPMPADPLPPPNFMLPPPVPFQRQDFQPPHGVSRKHGMGPRIKPRRRATPQQPFGRRTQQLSSAHQSGFSRPGPSQRVPGPQRCLRPGCPLIRQMAERLTGSSSHQSRQFSMPASSHQQVSTSDMDKKIEMIFQFIATKDLHQCGSRVVCSVATDSTGQSYGRVGSLIQNVFSHLGEPRLGSPAFVYQVSYQAGLREKNGDFCESTFLHCEGTDLLDLVWLANNSLDLLDLMRDSETAEETDSPPS